MIFEFNQQRFRWTFCFKLILPLLLFVLISLKPAAQVINIDGVASDWSGKTYNAYSHDRNNSNDNQFTQGSKDGNAISSWAWSDGQTNNKGDITNAAAILGVEMVGGVAHNILYFAGDRAVNNGDAAIGFWFFKGGVALDTTNAAPPYQGAFTGVHQDGDILVVSHFTQGGGQADIFIYKWQGSGLLAPITSSTAAVNSALQNIPSGFSYASAQYPIGDFFEGKVDLTTLGVPPCFTNFMLETRNSQSITASLQDLTFGSFTTSVTPPGTTGASRCGPGTVNLAASGCTGGTLKWFTAASGGTQVATGTSYSPSITATTTYYVSCTSAEGCISARTAVTATINGIPTVSADATPTGHVNVGSAPPHFSLTTTVNTILNNSGYNYSWSQDPPTGGSLSNTAISNPTFTATIGGTYTWTVTATDKVTGCSNTASVSRIIDNAAPCPDVPRSPVCQGTTHTYTADVGPASYETWTWSVNNGASLNTTSPNPANGGQSIVVVAGTQSFELTLTKKYANNTLPDLVCHYPITVNPLAAAPDVTYIGPSCTETTFKVQVNSPVSGNTYTLTQLDGNTQSITYGGSGTLIFTGLHIGQGFSVQASTAAGCKSSFNDCGTFTHTSTTRMTTPLTQAAPELVAPTVVAAPNPFNDRIHFSIKSPVSGQGTLEVYDMLGQKVRTIYQGSIQKGVQSFEYVVPGAQRANLIYIFRVGTYKVSGKLLNLRQ
jgi:hypothetical protein